MNIDVLIPLGTVRRCKYTGMFSAVVDAVDAEWAQQFNWTADLSCHGRRVYAVRRTMCPDGIKRKVYMHREIWERAFGMIPTGHQIDHREHGAVSGLDNRRTNLRLADEALNAANQRIRKDNSTGYKGVSWSKRLRKFEAYINVRGVRIRLGLFLDAASAAQAYDMAATDSYGEYALLNFRTAQA